MGVFSHKVYSLMLVEEYLHRLVSNLVRISSPVVQSARLVQP